MSAGLYTRFNLSEEGLNATDALQKLYGPQVQQDLLLFSFASRLESVVSSPSTESSNQIFGLINEPISDSSGTVFLRTKFVTLGSPSSDSSLQSLYTFSDNNFVWFDRVPSGFDKRTVTENSGAPIKVSVNGSMVAASVIGVGQNYSVLSSSGSVVTLPTTVNVRAIGLESGANNALVQVTVKSDGSIDQLAGVIIISPGTGYLDQELLELIPACGSEDDPSEDKCLNYSGNALYHNPFVSGQVSAKALLRNERYTYRVRFADRDGFFLYDDNTSEYVFLSSAYDSLQQFVSADTPALIVKRQDNISSQNLVQLYNLNGRSAFWSYGQNYEAGDSIGGTIRSLSDRAEELRDGFKYFVQNTKKPLIETDDRNTLGTRYNIIDGRNINSNYRLVFRDPDSVLDQSVYEETGTYAQSADVITVSITSHGLSTGDTVNLNFTTGTGVDGTYTVTITDPDTFTVVATDSKTTSGDVTAYQGVGFFQLRELTDAYETSIFGQSIPGIWLWTGDKYQRVFSSDDKPFLSQQGKKYLSPAIYDLNENTELAESGANKYSVSAGYLNPAVSSPGVSDIRGFDTQISVLVQNISSSSKPSNGGFVYHRQLTPDTVRTEPAYTVKAWPLFSYQEGSQVKDAKFLAI
jgi:hypothetical protein